MSQIEKLRRIAFLRHGHARKCKKSPFECEECQRNIRWFGELSPRDLSYVLREVRR